MLNRTFRYLRSVDSLGIDAGIPGRIEDDDAICTREREPHTADLDG
jgi:hypothetical protein